MIYPVCTTLPLCSATCGASSLMQEGGPYSADQWSGSTSARETPKQEHSAELLTVRHLSSSAATCAVQIKRRRASHLRGSGTSGSAFASHAKGTGIDTRLLQSFRGPEKSQLHIFYSTFIFMLTVALLMHPRTAPLPTRPPYPPSPSLSCPAQWRHRPLSIRASCFAALGPATCCGQPNTKLDCRREHGELSTSASHAA